MSCVKCMIIVEMITLLILYNWYKSTFTNLSKIIQLNFKKENYNFRKRLIRSFLDKVILDIDL